MIAASIFDLPELIPDREILEILDQSQAIRLERIISTGQRVKDCRHFPRRHPDSNWG